jgi:hypothetical protein
LVYRLGGVDSFKVAYQYKSSTYIINFSQSGAGKRNIVLDGNHLPDMLIGLQDDGTEHHVEIEWAEVEMTTA